MGLFSFKPNINKLKEKIDLAGLLKALRHEDKDIREKAAFALLDIVEPNKSEEHVEKLTQEIVRMAFLPNHEQDYESLLESLILSGKDKSEVVRWAAARILSFLVLCGKKDAQIVDILIAILKDPDPYVCAEAARGLSLSDDRRAVEPLLVAKVLHQVRNIGGQGESIAFLINNINDALETLGGPMNEKP